MISVQRITSNLVHLIRQDEIDVAVHGCNCFHRMGRGIAPILNELSDGALLQADMESPFGDINKMGTTTHAMIGNVKVYNAYTQYVWYVSVPGEPIYVHWESFYRAMCSIIGTMINEGHSRIAIPLIGCGLARGDIADFNRVIQSLVDVFHNYPQSIELTIVELG